jgi:hypothetical protein
MGIGEANTRTLVPADMLLHTIAHGARSNAVSPIRWVADAVHILRYTAIDWEKFVRRTQDLELDLVAWRTLDYLARHFDASIQTPVIEALENGATAFQRLEYRFGREHYPPWQNFALLFGQYVRQHPQPRWPRLLADFPDYMRRRWRVDSLAETARLSLKKAASLCRMPYPPHR